MRLFTASDGCYTSLPLHPRTPAQANRDVELLAFVQDLKGQEQVSGRRDYDALEHRLASLKLGKRKGYGPYAEGIAREKLLAERDALAGDVASFQRRARADLAAHLQNELRELVDRYEALKSKRGRLDFLDLLGITPNETQQSRKFASVEEFVAGEPRGLLTDVRIDLALVDGQGRIEVVENAFAG